MLVLVKEDLATYIGMDPHGERGQRAKVVVQDRLRICQVLWSILVSVGPEVPFFQRLGDALSFDQLSHWNLLLRTLPKILICRIDSHNDKLEHLFVKVACLWVVLALSIREDTLVKLVLERQVNWHRATEVVLILQRIFNVPEQASGLAYLTKL